MTDLQEKFKNILGQGTFAGILQVGVNNLKPQRTMRELNEKRKRLKTIQKKVKNNRSIRNKPYVHAILDEIVSAMYPIEE